MSGRHEEARDDRMVRCPNGEGGAGLGTRGQRGYGDELERWAGSRRLGGLGGQLGTARGGFVWPESSRGRGGHGDLRRKEEGAEDSGGLGARVRGE